jgi:hypothetical protein
MYTVRYLLGAVACLLISIPAGAGEALNVFSSGTLDAWTEHKFVGETDYSLVKENDVYILRAESHKSASILYQEKRVDLNETPFINWRWKIENTLGGIDEQTKKGDDYPTRVYVVIEPELFEIRPRSLDYVWSSNTAAGIHWKSAYSSTVVMLALRSGDRLAGRWVSEKRNLKADLKTYFKKDIRYIEGVAVMTDTDDTKTSAVAYYGDIFFSAD